MAKPKPRHRVRLICWDDEAAAAHAAVLAEAFDVDAKSPRAAGAMGAIAIELPDAVVIDLGQVPSHGRDVAVWLRVQAATRRVPLVFVGGEGEKVDAVRRLLPDATYVSTWGRAKSAVAKAIAQPVAEPVVPESALAGYSGRPLVTKLGIKPGMTVALVAAPDGMTELMSGLPDGARLCNVGDDDDAAMTIWFTRSKAEFQRGLGAAVKRADLGPVWFAWPKKTSKVATDLTQQHVREAALAAGLVDYKVCAIDDDWTGLLFRKRK